MAEDPFPAPKRAWPAREFDDVTPEMRRHAKVINFGVLYGMSQHGLSVATGMTIIKAKEFIDRYFTVRQPIRDFLDKTIRQAETEGYVETLFGRRRPTPDVTSSNFMVREGAKRAAANMPIQGTEADLMKMSMLKVEREIPEASQFMQNVALFKALFINPCNAKLFAVFLKDRL